jgi:hypothetical protein
MMVSDWEPDRAGSGFEQGTDANADQIKDAGSTPGSGIRRRRDGPKVRQGDSVRSFSSRYV